MSQYTFPQKAAKFEIESYKKPKDYATVRKTHVSYTGSLQKHLYDSSRVILVADPFSENRFFYEFRSEDISYLEKLPNLVTIDGETITLVRIWVKKNSTALRCVPFVVQETTLFD